ncbi:PspC domain-containing protein [Saccharopolyspora dendranthemae]|uniref:Phage shock protein C (PspC) family protein n=1 Tax=Saccharopolyspora dendranthemae TaxID=1181886 RepID=A0A561U0W5_9PSEU|nr:PspC domain-containing protein [Saccharopolyspora dendranthemae]TWF93008.1 phage shock protein C (PspC) family protein [Saccharopolyspora dendranthemae]
MNSTQQTGGFEATVRDFWATRPVRPSTGSKAAGVSAAIARRYGVDSILVRVGFVVLFCYGGAGLVLYMLGWLLFPKEAAPLPGQTTPRREPTRTWVAVTLVLLLVPAMLWMINSIAVLGLAAGPISLYFLHRNQGDRQVTGTSDPPAQATPTGENTWVYPGTTAQQTPPSWDPLGAAPFAWDLPEPQEPEPPEPRARRFRWYNPLALLVAFVGATAVASLGAPGYFATATALGLLGVAMMIGAFLRVGRWPIVLAVPLALVALLSSVAHQYRIGDDLDLGDVQVAPVEITDVQPVYDRDAGTLDLDLSALRISTGDVVRTTASVGAGRVQIRVPSTVDVSAECEVEMGESICLNRHSNGQDVHQSITDLGPDGPGGGEIVLNATAGTGNVEVIRD